MADKRQVCGSKPITYPENCSYSCVCPAGTGPCTWTVNCQGTIFTGTGLVAEGGSPHPPHATLEGSIAECAEMLQYVWQRRVIVPPNVRGRRVRKRTLRGTPEQIAVALGLQLGPKLPKRKPRDPKGDFVRIGVRLRARPASKRR